jgi:AAA15 family ATPase/GTPase
MVLYSQTRLESKDTPIDVRPFTFDPKYVQRPSRFEIEFVCEGVRTQYGFVANQHHVFREWLFTYPHKRRRILFTREIDADERPSIYFGESLTSSRERQLVLEETTRSNSLTLSAAAQINFDEFQKYYDWFSKELITVFPEDRDFNIEHLKHRLVAEDVLTREVLMLLSFADIGIVDIRTREIDLPDEMMKQMNEVLKPEFIERLHEFFPKVTELSLVHRAATNSDASLDLSEESRGTRNLLALIGPLLSGVDASATLCVDEFTASLHPHVARRVVEFIHSQSEKGQGPQLVFASHDTSLLDYNLFRRDQIWFTEKGNDGATHLYPLSDFHPRKGENLARGYLQGRYGAIPFIGPSDIGDATTKAAILDRSGQPD